MIIRPSGLGCPVGVIVLVSFIEAFRYLEKGKFSCQYLRSFLQHFSYLHHNRIYSLKSQKLGFPAPDSRYLIQRGEQLELPIVNRKTSPFYQKILPRMEVCFLIDHFHHKKTRTTMNICMETQARHDIPLGIILLNKEPTSI